MASLASQAHFNNYSPDTYQWPHRTPNLVPFTYKGVNFGQCASDVHGWLTAVLDELVPHIPGGLLAGKCWAYSATDDLDDGSWSFHHYGLAMDVNWSKNPMGNYTTNPYAGQTYAIPAAICSAIVTRYGGEYGGDWHGFKDFMHIECHLSPAVARTVRPTGVAAAVRKTLTRKSAFPYSTPGVYFGPITGPAWSHGGANATERAYVRVIQTMLHNLHFYNGVVDGVYGPSTVAAVKAWQKSRHYKWISGRIYASTWKVLMGS